MSGSPGASPSMCVDSHTTAMIAFSAATGPTIQRAGVSPTPPATAP